VGLTCSVNKAEEVEPTGSVPSGLGAILKDIRWLFGLEALTECSSSRAVVAEVVVDATVEVEEMVERACV